MAFLFEKLDVYQQSVDLADVITDFTETFPRGKYYLKDQLNRAIMSVPNNIAEGNGRFHKGDKKNFFLIARGSAAECVPLLEMCKRKGLLDDGRYNEYKGRLDNTCKMLSGLISGVER